MDLFRALVMMLKDFPLENSSFLFHRLVKFRQTYLETKQTNTNIVHHVSVFLPIWAHPKRRRVVL